MTVLYYLYYSKILFSFSSLPSVQPGYSHLLADVLKWHISQ